MSNFVAPPKKPRKTRNKQKAGAESALSTAIAAASKTDAEKSNEKIINNNNSKFELGVIYDRVNNRNIKFKTELIDLSLLDDSDKRKFEEARRQIEDEFQRYRTEYTRMYSMRDYTTELLSNARQQGDELIKRMDMLLQEYYEKTAGLPTKEDSEEKRNYLIRQF